MRGGLRAAIVGKGRRGEHADTAAGLDPPPQTATAWWAVEEPLHPEQGRLALAVGALLERPRDQVQQRLVVHIDAARSTGVVEFPLVAQVEDGEAPHSAVGS